MTDEEWGPWIEHNGKRCPIIDGQIVNAVMNKPIPKDNEIIRKLIAVGPDWLIYMHRSGGSLGSWFWEPGYHWVVRYRIRKPRGLTILEGLLENLPEDVDA